MKLLKMMRAMALVFCLLLPVPAKALVSDPTEEEIQAAIERGKQIAVTEKREEDIDRNGFNEFLETYNFGTGGSCNSGRVDTKVNFLIVLSYGKNKQYSEISTKDIELIDSLKDFYVTVVTCYSSPEYTQKDHLVIKVGDKIIQPASIEKTVKNLGGVYQNRTAASFPYDAFHGVSVITVIVVPPIDEELQFEVNLANMP